jgi:hypothetical protein
MFGRGKMRRLWARHATSPMEDLQQAASNAGARRNRQKNLKASPACIAAFAHLARVSQMSEAALFEDMVAQRWEEVRRSADAK